MTTSFILYIQLCLVVLLTVCCCKQTWADSTLSLIQSRLLNMLKQKQRSYFRRTVRSHLDLREHRLFHSDPALECCPTVTEMIRRHTGINRQGVVLELFRTPNNTQTFYETLCHPAFKNRQCQYIDPRISYATRCIQQYSYVYAIGRTYGIYRESFGLDYIRIASGCKCEVVRDYLKRRKKRGVTN